MVSNAALTAASIAGAVAPATVISTYVPSSGLARRRLSEAIAIYGQYPLDPFSHMRRRQRRSRNIRDITVDPEWAAAGLAHELRKPARAVDLPAIRFPVLQYLDLLH